MRCGAWRWRAVCRGRTRFTRQKSQVRSLSRPPAQTLLATEVLDAVVSRLSACDRGSSEALAWNFPYRSPEQSFRTGWVAHMRGSRLPAPSPNLTMPRDALDQRLEDRIARAADLLKRPISDENALEVAQGDLSIWNDYNFQLLQRAFSTLEIAREYEEELNYENAYSDSIEDKIRSFRYDVRVPMQWLQSLKERIEFYEEEVNKTDPTAAKRASQSAGTTVFVVHGRSEAPKEAVARFLGRISTLQPVILREQANSGRTIIEKFEDYAATAAFAVVLLTGDDEGRLRGHDELQPRARQNVVFELGFFVAFLTRARVAVLYEPGVELPSDMSGVLYTELDPAGGWRLELAKEMQAAGLKVDLNLAL
jgi:predicted nucleotide-binding protein